MCFVILQILFKLTRCWRYWVQVSTWAGLLSLSSYSVYFLYIQYNFQLPLIHWVNISKLPSDPLNIQIYQINLKNPKSQKPHYYKCSFYYSALKYWSEINNLYLVFYVQTVHPLNPGCDQYIYKERAKIQSNVQNQHTCSCIINSL